MEIEKIKETMKRKNYKNNRPIITIQKCNYIKTKIVVNRKSESSESESSKSENSDLD